LLKDLLRLLRVPLAPTAACDTVACLLLALGAGGVTGSPGALDWAQLIATSLCIYGFGMGLNDWADRGRDRLLNPARPLPSGRLAPALALGVVLLLGVAALALGGGPLGSWEAVGWALLLAAFYDLAGKRVLVPGALSMGGVRAANAAIGVLPLVRAGLTPAWTLLAPLAVGCWSAAATVLSTTEEEPSPTRVRVARVLALLALVLAATLAMVAAGRFTLASVLAAASVLSLAFGKVPKPGPVKRQVLEMLLGLYLVAAVIAGGDGRWEVELGALALAFGLTYLTQRMIFALRVPG
jgi:4-hydroxybenzoate polyprenyltransferase